jgi:hypothetical protein
MLDLCGQHVIASLGSLALGDVTYDFGCTGDVAIVDAFDAKNSGGPSMRRGSMAQRVESPALLMGAIAPGEADLSMHVGERRSLRCLAAKARSQDGRWQGSIRQASRECIYRGHHSGALDPKSLGQLRRSD